MRERRISASEWHIMELLWEASPRTMTQLVSALREQTGWAKSTVTTMVSRMEVKGLLRVESGGRARLYAPAVTRDEVARQETTGLLDRVYRGSVGLLLHTLVEEKPLSKAEIDELYAILRQAEETSEE